MIMIPTHYIRHNSSYYYILLAIINVDDRILPVRQRWEKTGEYILKKGMTSACELPQSDKKRP